ncbi:sigma-70 family RNA polymerase sigma factor [Actinoplanes sp. TBRC 11911]|uniref:RNA polymerase sigma factor n=1 Tax=Actinoplanes sp. TBRC 11911 TaxID=2729386 RepID=UPI00145D4C32|nr:sigma-70 family RNA polymerase sigma factor [Actinoplanes sp. TBRC 11911]NMO51444.1 sigma-70 family RNA polymerase sigma factor [Actinoplanes sp. TBRC 11911]
MVQLNKELAATASDADDAPDPDAPPSSVDEQFTAFFNIHYKPLLVFATVWGKSYHDADEAVGTVMAYIYDNWTKIRNPVAYARAAVPRTIIKIRRDRHDDRYVPVPNASLPDQVDRCFELDLMQDEQWTEELLDELPPTQRAVLIRFLDGLSMTEIAAELRKSESTIRQNLKLARDRLRPLVDEYDRNRPCPSHEDLTREDNR